MNVQVSGEGGLDLDHDEQDYSDSSLSSKKTRNSSKRNEDELLNAIVSSHRDMMTVMYTRQNQRDVSNLEKLIEHKESSIEKRENAMHQLLLKKIDVAVSNVSQDTKESITTEIDSQINYERENIKQLKDLYGDTMKSPLV